jgi:lipoprotein-anchoring transpeptidase ErfK/SrfK
MQSPHWWSRTRLLGGVAAAMVIAVTAGCSQSPGARWHQASDQVSAPGGGGSAEVTKAPGSFVVTPAADTADVSVLDPVTVAAKDAALEAVTVTNPDGKQVQGGWDAGHASWHTTEDLGYGKRYTVHATGTNSTGQPLEQTTAFTTMKPAAQAMPYLRSNDNHLLKEHSTYGVGQPIVIYFDRKVPDKAAAQRLLTVTADPPVEGSWNWISSQEVHYRPEKYWAPGTAVSVTANLYGKDLGSGTYGQADVSASFKIGPSRIAIADATTKHMQVFIDGSLSRDIPVSLGKGGNVKGANGETINYWTNSGPHVVLEKTPTTRMTSASYGLTNPKDPNFYDEVVKLTVRISDTGEFVHMADWNIPQQGKENTSHGCINVGPSNAQWFYDTFGPGDVVDVRGTPVRLGLTNGLGDWGMSWSEWKKGSAL